MSLLNAMKSSHVTRHYFMIELREVSKFCVLPKFHRVRFHLESRTTIYRIKIYTAFKLMLLISSIIIISLYICKSITKIHQWH